mmetsp:Transcript_16194/g.31339  ORF Transcript_16194/g.31339 Transcript_16194/m.31339 type:complete len:272 (+) Transcript_16194:798-1613(+)
MNNELLVAKPINKKDSLTLHFNKCLAKQCRKEKSREPNAHRATNNANQIKRSVWPRTHEKDAKKAKAVDKINHPLFHLRQDIATFGLSKSLSDIVILLSCKVRSTGDCIRGDLTHGGTSTPQNSRHQASQKNIHKLGLRTTGLTSRVLALHAAFLEPNVAKRLKVHAWAALTGHDYFEDVWKEEENTTVKSRSQTNRAQDTKTNPPDDKFCVAFNLVCQGVFCSTEVTIATTKNRANTPKEWRGEDCLDEVDDIINSDFKEQNQCGAGILK